MLPTIRRSTSPQSLYEEYVKGKQTLSEIAEKHGISVSTVQRRMRKVHSTRIVSKYKEVVILMDATYWGRDFGVLLIVDAYRKRLLWRKFLDKKETIADYLEGIEWLRENNFIIRGIVCDGLRGLAQSLSQYKVQYCQFHQVKTAVEYLTKNPQTEAGQELLKIAYLLCHTDKESFEGMLEMWHTKWDRWLKQRTLDRKTGKKVYTHRRVRSAYFSMKRNMKWLWTYYDYPDTPIPNTNNILEAINTDLKSKLRVHNGMSKRYRKLFIDEYFKLKYK